MSGNPFRASLSQKPTAVAAPAPTISFINADSSSSDETARELDTGNASSPPPARTKKSVRIESPTSSAPHPVLHDADDPLVHRINRGKHTGSPPPTSPAAFSDNFEDIDTADPFDKDGSGDSTYGIQDITGSKRRSSDMVGTVNSPTSAPANPFARTLATIEPQEKGSAELAHTAGQSRERTTPEKPSLGTPKANLDVEGFKRLLMTGISSPSSSGQPSQPATAPNPSAPSIFESSSSTDTSSISRQSIFEPVPEPHVETPRTSYEMAPSDEETVGLVTEVKKTEKKKPPPAPKHRHGKLVTSRTPQTVSFSDFSVTEASFAPTTPSRNRNNSDLNKPLPPTPPVVSPPAHIVSQDASQDEPPPLETKASESSSQSDAPAAQKKVPPPVPLARRQSQLRTSSASNRSRSNSNLTMSSQHSAEFPPVSPGATTEQKPPTSQKTAPPPPPARRHGASLTGGNPPSTNSSTTELSSTASVRRATVSLPDPPSSRRTTFSSPPPSPVPGQSGLTRTSSISSNRNNPRSVSNESATMPPPPPPPRRRQSGRTSMDKERPLPPSSSPTESRRTSSEIKRSSFEGKRRTSVASESSLRYEYAPASGNEHALYSPKEEADEPRSLEPVTIPQSDSSNILDDMEKFQREIDELRERYRQ